MVHQSMCITSVLQQAPLSLIHAVNADNFSVTAGGFFHDSGIINANDYQCYINLPFENYQPIYADNSMLNGKHFEM